jgi:enterochelin esterase family protein
MHVSDRDILITRDNSHDSVLANERMANALAAKGHPPQFVFAKKAVHRDRAA